jgi:hypothetical protein
MEPEPNPYREVVGRTQKLINLMTSHRISRKGNLLHFMAMLNLTAPAAAHRSNHLNSMAFFWLAGGAPTSALTD